MKFSYIFCIFALRNLKFSVDVNASQSYLSKYDTDPGRLVPISMNITPSSNTELDVGKNIKEHYFGSTPVVDTYLEFIKVLFNSILFQIICTFLRQKYSLPITCLIISNCYCNYRTIRFPSFSTFEI